MNVLEKMSDDALKHILELKLQPDLIRVKKEWVRRYESRVKQIEADKDGTSVPVKLVEDVMWTRRGE